MTTDFELAIVGGGLGGLTMAIYMAKKGHRVVVFEKETYPFHKVCGEYISNESKPYLQALGIDFEALRLPNIDTVAITSIKGKRIEQALDLGGFGVSRYTLDSQLAAIARTVGVEVIENCKITSIDFHSTHFVLKHGNTSTTAKLVAGAFGKRSNIDVKLNRDFIREKPNSQNNFIGVKWHVKTSNFSDNFIELHNFESGYCGMSKVDNDTFCMCYLSTANALKVNNNSIAQLQENVLFKNPYLANRFSESEMLFEAPITISQVGFKAKTAVENHVLMIGDAAGAIAPLCGNGMSMSINAGYIAANLCIDFLHNKIDQEQLEKQYTAQWQQKFGTRIKAGYWLQHLFGNTTSTEMALGTLKHFPGVVSKLITLTHGQDFYRD